MNKKNKKKNWREKLQIKKSNAGIKFKTKYTFYFRFFFIFILYFLFSYKLQKLTTKKKYKKYLQTYNRKQSFFFGASLKQQNSLEKHQSLMPIPDSSSQLQLWQKTPQKIWNWAHKLSVFYDFCALFLFFFSWFLLLHRLFPFSLLVQWSIVKCLNIKRGYLDTRSKSAQRKKKRIKHLK